MKPETLRVAEVGLEAITEVALPVAGPAHVTPFVGGNVIVAVGSPQGSESDVPDESAFESTFYVVDLSARAARKIGGPYLAVSPDLRHVVRKTDGTTVVLEDTETKRLVQLAKGAREYVTQFMFSPDNKRLAYLALDGDRNDVFMLLYRPVDESVIVGARLIVRLTDGVGEPVDVIRGGYSVQSAWNIDRWTSPTVLEYVQSEFAGRTYEFDAGTSDKGAVKKGLIDWERI